MIINNVNNNVLDCPLKIPKSRTWVFNNFRMLNRTKYNNMINII